MNSKFLLEAKGIQKHYKKGKLKISVLKGVNFSVAPQETVAIVGSSGAGKSTLLHILGTLDEPSVGKVFFKGSDIFGRSEEERCRFRNRHLGFVFQFHYLLPEFTALENVMMPGLIAGRSESTLKPEAERLLAEVGLGSRLKHRPAELSGGESQRVALARALIMKPALLLADEPTGNLDSENSAHMMALLSKLNKEHGIGVVVVTHDRVLAGSMQRTVEMKDGQLDL